MARPKYLLSAQQDLGSILRYIAYQSGSAAVAEEFVRSLRQKCAHIAGLPAQIGRPRPDLRSDVRSFAFRGYVIIFRYVGDRFEIINILEGHRDIVALYGPPND